MPLMEIAGGIAAKVAIPATRSLLTALLDVQDQQLQKLTTIEQDVRRLLEGPWRQAHVLVAEAAQTRDNDPQRIVYLNEARQALFQAFGNHPNTHPARAAIAAELSMVLGLLGRTEDCHRWSATAHDEAVAVVTTAIPQVQAAVNRREWLLPVESMRKYIQEFEYIFKEASFKERKRNFWKYWTYSVETEEDKELLRSKIESFYEERVPSGFSLVSDTGEESWATHFGLDPSKHRGFKLAVEYQLETLPGRQLIRLRQEADQAEEYRCVRTTLQPSLALPRYRLKVDLAGPHRARLSWVPASQADRP
jgi:hypothetical protein